MIGREFRRAVERIVGTFDAANLLSGAATDGFVLTADGASGAAWEVIPAQTDAAAIHDNVASEISAIAEKTTPVSGDMLIIEDSAAANAKKMVQVGNLPRYVPLTTPLTSTSWDGDARSTTASTLIDLSAVFGVPAGVKAVYVQVQVRDSGAGGGDYYFLLSADGSSWQAVYVPPSAADFLGTAHMIVPCDANGDIYFSLTASGASTMDVWLAVWGYYV